MPKFPFPHWDTLAWAIVLAAAVALEAVGLMRPNEATLSALIRAVVPVWARAALIGWLAYHFLIQQ